MYFQLSMTHDTHSHSKGEGWGDMKEGSVHSKTAAKASAHCVTEFLCPGRLLSDTLVAALLQVQELIVTYPGLNLALRMAISSLISCD